MKPEKQLSEGTDLTPHELETIVRVARRQAEAVATPTDESVDWRTLGYVVVGASILLLLTLQLVI